MIDRAIQWMFHRNERHERAYLRGGREAKRTMRLVMLRFLIPLAGWATWAMAHPDHGPLGWVSFITALIFGFVGSAFAMAPVTRAQVCRNATYRARRELLESFEEAGRRGMDHHDWLDAEVERTWSIY